MYPTIPADGNFPTITKEHYNKVFKVGEAYYLAEKTTKRWYIVVLKVETYEDIVALETEPLRILHAVTIKPNPPSESQHHKFF